ncbi:MAG TPA: hypothetical protein VGD45_27705 [Steroidobacter sp.]|uniref:hypothetical protein n=1 Tax=Steroidobacter sp. TaxID=1978227 RepID=UPI002ED98997
MPKIIALWSALRCDWSAILLRLSCAAAAIQCVQATSDPGRLLALGAGVVAACLTLGFATPLAAAILLAAELGVLTGQSDISAFLIASHVLSSFALACLGPGNLSLDARLFARRKRVVTNRR